MTEGGPSPPHPSFGTLVGRTCDEVSPLVEPYSAVFRFGDARLHVHCLWRVIANGSLRATSDDHGHPYGLGAPVDA